MTVTLTQDNVLGRIRVDATGLAAADVAIIERSIDQITWTQCRGASAWPVTAGAFANPFDDYEFIDGVVNYYRVSGVETAPMAFVDVGAAVSGNNASLTPPLPAGLVEGDLMVLFASIRNSGAGFPNPPTGWNPKLYSENVALLSKRYVSGDAAPLVTFGGGVANADTMARIAAWRRAGETVVTSLGQLNGSAQDIAYPALAIPDDDLLIIDAAWKADDYSANTARPSPGTFTSIGGVTSTAGDDAGMSWWYQIQTNKADLTSGTHTVTGGAAAISRSMVVALRHADYLNRQTNSITPALTGTWLKSLRRPYLNRLVNVLDYSDITRESNNAAFRVIGRTYPVGVADVMGARKWTMTVWTDGLSNAGDLDSVLAAGDIWFVHVPVGCAVPGGYVIIDGDVTRRRPSNSKRQTERRFFDLPFAEVAAPDDDVAGTTGTWATVIASYATWADLIADRATWADVLELIGSPDEVIVP